MTLAAPGPGTLGDLLDVRAATRGNHPLLICDNETLSYSDAAERSATLARGLIASGLSHGSRLGLIFPNGAAFAVATLAAARIGAITIPLSTFSTAPELRTLLRNAGVEMVLSAVRYRRHDYVERLGDALSELDFRTTAPPLFSTTVPSLRLVAFASSERRVDPAWTVPALLDAGRQIDAEVVPASQARITPSDRLVIVHTSGSTAEPKGVIHTHGSLLAHLRILNELRRYDEDQILFCNSPFFWIGGYAYALVGSLEAGATLVCSNAVEASDVLDVLERTRPTMVNGFAQSVAYLADDPTFPQRDLTSITRGNLYPIMAAAVRSVDPDLRHNMLGLTETGSVCLASDDESPQPEARRGSFGRPVPGLEAKVVEAETGDEVALGQEGELALRGPAVMDGYNGKERHETFDADGWFHTGDNVHVDGDGFFYFHGRAGDMIKTAGANVSPREVEAALVEETGLVAHVFGLEDPDHGQLVAAVIRVPSGTTAPDPTQITARLRRRLSAYKVPKRMVMLDEKDVPLMSSGKLDTRAVKDLVRAH